MSNMTQLEKMHQTAAELYENKDLDKALEIYEEIIKVIPNDEIALSCIMDIYLEKDDKFNYYLARANVNIAQNKLEYAINDTKKALNIDIDNIRLDDKKTFDLLKRADSLAVFQIESSGMIGMLKQIKPDNIEDIIALISLYRPGPMDNIPTYIKRKHGQEKVEYMHPKMEPILRDTYGIIIYQEQVMNIAKVLAGYTLGGADILRRAMGKKIKEEMDKQRDVFVKGT